MKADEITVDVRVAGAEEIQLLTEQVKFLRSCLIEVRDTLDVYTVDEGDKVGCGFDFEGDPMPECPNLNKWLNENPRRWLITVKK